MAELYPLPLEHLLNRALLEFEKNRQIYDLPERLFFKPSDRLNTTVSFCGRKAATPVGPASGPHTQLAQNIVLSWLAGARVMELKTVQILDRLRITRPCIDVRNIGHNVEWSQELRLEESLREYVAAHILIEILTAANVLNTAPGPLIFDISVGYDLAGITSKKVRSWLRTMKDASALVDRLISQIPPEFAEFRNLPFRTKISESITLSTFHGCPADEIEKIVEFLIAEMDFDVMIKMNPPMLGKDRVRAILHDKLGYDQIEVNPQAYATGITFDEGVEIVERLRTTAGRCNRHVGVKFSNTLEVINKNDFFSDEVMYLSGEPLHVLAMTLVREWRKVFGTEIPISFAAGVDSRNVADAVSCGLVPVTSCTDLLRPGGYGRLNKYMANLHGRMEQVGASDIDQFILAAYDTAEHALAETTQTRMKHLQGLPKLKSAARAKIAHFFQRMEGKWRRQMQKGKWPDETTFQRSLRRFIKGEADLAQESTRFLELLGPFYRQWVETAALLNTSAVVAGIHEDARYGQAKNSKVPRKIGSHLELFDCINCDKCVPVCPNDANFIYEITPLEQAYSRYRLTEEGPVEEPAGVFSVSASHQIGNYADFCNDCGNCDIFCPEDGGPFIEKPRFFGSAESYARDTTLDGFYIEMQNDLVHVLARIQNKSFTFLLDRMADRARFSDDCIEIECDASTHEVLACVALVSDRQDHILDMRYYLTTAVIVSGVLDSKLINYINGRRALVT